MPGHNHRRLVIRLTSSAGGIACGPDGQHGYGAAPEHTVGGTLDESGRNRGRGCVAQSRRAVVAAVTAGLDTGSGRRSNGDNAGRRWERPKARNSSNSGGQPGGGAERVAAPTYRLAVRPDGVSLSDTTTLGVAGLNVLARTLTACPEPRRSGRAVRSRQRSARAHRVGRLRRSAGEDSGLLHLIKRVSRHLERIWHSSRVC